MDEITKKKLEKEKVSVACIWGILMLGGLQRRPKISSLLRKNTKRCSGPKSLAVNVFQKGERGQPLQMLVIAQIK